MITPPSPPTFILKTFHVLCESSERQQNKGDGFKFANGNMFALFQAKPATLYTLQEALITPHRLFKFTDLM